MKSIAIIIGIAVGLWFAASLAIRFAAIIFLGMQNNEISFAAVSIFAAIAVGIWFWNAMNN